MGFNVPGVMVAGIAVFSTAMQQVLVGHLQKKHQIGANELVGVTAPMQVRRMSTTVADISSRLLREGRGHLSIAGTNRARGGAICPEREPIVRA